MVFKKWFDQLSCHFRPIFEEFVLCQLPSPPLFAMMTVVNGMTGVNRSDRVNRMAGVTGTDRREEGEILALRQADGPTEGARGPKEYCLFSAKYFGGHQSKCR